MRRALALGCGGTLGFAWSVGALRAVERDLGWDARTAEIVVGTSAGAELAVLLGSGYSVADVLAALEGSPSDQLLADHLTRSPARFPPLPGLGWPAAGLTARALRGRVDVTAGLAGLLPRGRGNATWLRDLGERLATPEGWVRHPATWLVAAHARTGHRVAFGSPGAPRLPLGEALAASWAVPGWFPPVRGYLDGGTISSVSADLLLDRGVDEVVVIAPMTSQTPAPATGAARLERVLRRRMTRGLDREVARLWAAGIRVRRVEPTPADLAAMGPNFMDVRRRAATTRRVRA
ncbi:NTE family protein [Crossiella equi]|uniref:NTE family protein n=1 Tax=Crossiella equi TaxID=130796 RepID=A0ABS5A6Q0_9PSEU|nr:patatin-like phospholipase family protein [Crossiella equi]MBP2472279.1 NTE family protein [Crossiella equi]